MGSVLSSKPEKLKPQRTQRKAAEIAKTSKTENQIGHNQNKCLSDTYATMSDMASNRITIRVPKGLEHRLRGRSRASGKTPSEIVRVALEAYLGAEKGRGSAFEMATALGLIGCAGRLPKDLSTNPKHFDGFGKQE